MAKAHEIAAKAMESEVIAQSFEKLIGLYEKYVSALSYLELKQSTEKEKIILEQEEINGLWKKIKNCSQEFDIDGINHAISVLKTAQLSETESEYLKELSEAAEMLDYEVIEQLVTSNGE